MTVRAVILGLIGALVLGALGCMNDQVLHLTRIVGNHFPISVFGTLVVLVMFANPLLKWLSGAKDRRLRSGELAVILAFMLVVCSIPSGGLMRTFTATLALPAHMNKTETAWQKYRLLPHVPPRMLAGEGRYVPAVHDGFLNGLRGKSDSPAIALSDVPWEHWGPPLATWAPILVLIAVAEICLSLIVHRQWSSRERLRYPIAVFAKSIMGPAPGQGGGPIYRCRAFQLGLVSLLVLRLINGLYAWDLWIFEVPMNLDFTPLLQKFPWVQRTMQTDWVFNVRIYPTVIAFATILAADVGLSLGLAGILNVVVFSGLLKLGIVMGGNAAIGGTIPSQHFGSYLGATMILLYTGRHYYGSVLKQALTFVRQKGVEGHAAWALRFLLVAVALLTVLLTHLAVPWPLALLFVLLTLMMYLVMSRLNAECGVFTCYSGWGAAPVIAGLFGYYAVGPAGFLVMSVVASVLTVDARECLMPYVVNALKICDDASVRPARVAAAKAGVHVVVLAAAIVVMLWANYNYGYAGLGTPDPWVKGYARSPFVAASGAFEQLHVRGLLDASSGLTVAQRLGAFQPQEEFLWAAGIGLGLVLVFSYLRLRLPWWPLHPVLFLVWGTGPGALVSGSFLLGWIVRTIVVRLGGRQSYRGLTTFMIGVIAGDMLGGLAFMAVGAIYHAVTGLPPKVLNVLPM